MDQQGPRGIPTPLNVKFSGASNLPMQHINAMGVQSSSDEFFFTLGVVVPPDQEELAKVIEAGSIVAQPVYRFAISRDNMEKFIALMKDQYDQQAVLVQELQRIKINSEEASKNE